MFWFGFETGVLMTLTVEFAGLFLSLLAIFVMRRRSSPFNVPRRTPAPPVSRPPA